MRLRYPGKMGFLGFSGLRRLRNIIRIVNIARCVELRHKKSIHIPKFCFDQRTFHLFKTERHQPAPHIVQISPIGMVLPNKHARRLNRQIISAKRRTLPCAFLNHFGRKTRNFIAREIGFDNLHKHALSFSCKAINPLRALIQTNRPPAPAAFAGIGFNILDNITRKIINLNSSIGKFLK